MRRILVTGVTGFARQSPRGLPAVARRLRDRRHPALAQSAPTTSRTSWIASSCVECDLRDASSTRDTLESVRPEWIFHLAAQSFVPTSWTRPTESLTTNILGQVNMFEAVRTTRHRRAASSSRARARNTAWCYPDEVPIRETNPLRPLSPYAVSKVAQDLLGYQYWMSWKVDCVRTRGFNHEGPRRGPVFVASDFAKQIADIEKGRKPPVLRVGNLEAKRDFTDVRDMVRAYWLALEKCAAGETSTTSAAARAWAIREVLDLLLVDDRKAKIEVPPGPGAAAAQRRAHPARRQLEVRRGRPGGSLSFRSSRPCATCSTTGGPDSLLLTQRMRSILVGTEITAFDAEVTSIYSRPRSLGQNPAGGSSRVPCLPRCRSKPPMDSTISLASVWERVWARRRPVVVVVASATLIVGAIAFLLRPWYRAEAELLPPSEEETGVGIASLLRGMAVPGIRIPTQVTPADVFMVGPG